MKFMIRGGNFYLKNSITAQRILDIAMGMNEIGRRGWVGTTSGQKVGCSPDLLGSPLVSARELLSPLSTTQQSFLRVEFSVY